MAASINVVEEIEGQTQQPRIPIHTGDIHPDGFPLLRLVGQVAATYLVAEGPDGLYLIDQHAAHERVLFEQLMAQQAEKRVPAQRLLEPVNVVLPPEKARLLAEQLPVLDNLGFDVEPFGPNAFTIRAIPSLLFGGDPEEALYALVEDFEEDESPLGTEIEAKLTARICKRMAVKGGQVLSPEEQHALLRTSTAGPACPRTSAMIHLSADLLSGSLARRPVIC